MKRGPRYSNSTDRKLLPAGPGVIEVRPESAGCVIGAVFLVLGLAGAALAAWGLLGGRWGIPPAPLPSALFNGALFAIFFLAAAVLVIANRGRITFDGRVRRVTFRPPLRGLPAAVPFEAVEAVQIVRDDEDDEDWADRETGEKLAGAIDLVLRDPPGGRVGVVMRDARRARALTREAASLAGLLGVPVVDRRFAPVPGMAALTARGLLHGPAFIQYRLEEAGRDLLVLKPLRRPFGLDGCLMAFMGVFIAAVLAAFITAAVLADAPCFMVMAVLCVMPVAMGLRWAYRMRHPRTLPLVLDRARKQIRQADPAIGLDFPSADGEVLRLADVAAVQLATGLADSGSGPRRLFEINLVLRSPAGRRLPLMTHSHQSAALSDAQRIALHLELPLLDHTGEA